jgi:prepilin-type N-terminal cleavage/methylation domain-containing protein
MVAAFKVNVVFHRYYIRPRAGFTLIETIVAISVLAIGVATTIGALTKINAMAAAGRNTTGAYAVLMNQVDLFQSMSPFNPQKVPQNADPCSGQIPPAQVPKDNCHGSYPLYDMTVTAAGIWRSLSVDGTTFNVPVYQYKDPVNGTVVVVQGLLQVQVTDLNFAGTNPSSGPYQALFKVSYTYLGRSYSFQVSSIRSSDI